MSNEDVTASEKWINVLLDDIKLNVNIEMFKHHLQKCSRVKVEEWKDKNQLDLLHHAILENNFVVVGTFFALGYFKPPHEVVSSWQYVHLAAVLGQRTIVSMLLQERPYDNKKMLLDWELFHEVIAPKLDITKVTTSIVPTEEKEKQFAFLPLDLAARYGHIQSVKTILDFHIFRSQQSQGTARRSSLVKTGHMNMACSLDSPFAVRILLTDNPETDDIKNALDAALKMAKPECVDALLRYGVDTKQMFGGMNMFHVLFAYSKSFEESWFESFVTVTSVLIRHHQDVNACRPSRTYPLYSLLRCTRMASMEKSVPFIMAALLILLQGGADPNFDEVFVEEAVRDREQSTAFGRKPYASAFHCLVDAAVNYMEEVPDTEHVSKYLYKTSELLLYHGADPSYIGKYHNSHDDSTQTRGNALHVLCDAMLYLGRPDSSLLLLLLRHGANPDACVDNRYPLMAYVDAISSMSHHRASPDSERAQQRNVSGETAASLCRGSPESERVRPRNVSVERAVCDETSDFVVDVRRMCRMVGFMSRAAQLDCARHLQSRLVEAPPGGSTSPDTTVGLRLVLKQLEKHTLCVPSLRRCCAITVWCCCRRHVGNLYKLSLPTPLIHTVVDNV